MDTTTLISRAKQADVVAYGELVRTHQDLAIRTAYLVTGDHADAEDVAQIAFVKAYTKLQTLKNAEQFRSWLLRIVTNEARNLRRSTSRRDQLRLRVSVPRDESSDLSPEEFVVAAEQQQTVLDGLNALPDGDRLILTYRYTLDLSIDEIARVLDVRPGAVRTRLHRSRRRLRDHLRQGTGDSSPAGYFSGVSAPARISVEKERSGD